MEISFFSLDSFTSCILNKARKKNVVILRRAFWDPFGEAERACPTKDLLLPLLLVLSLNFVL